MTDTRLNTATPAASAAVPTSNPAVVNTLAPATSGFASLGLTEALTKALVASGYTTPTPIQAQGIPPLLAGKDLLGLAETGTGKTAAFVLPILQALAKIGEPVAPRTCRALILAPTRELAIQIGESIETYGKNLNVRHTVVFGGVGSRPQVRAMDRGVDILVATPGRLLDLMGTRNVQLHKIQFLVLDEADRMLDMGFIRDVKRIIKEVPKVRQSLLFSATMPQDITALANEILHHPVRVEIARAGKTVDRIDQVVHFVDTKSKRAALAALLQDKAMSRVIVFARTKHGADRIARGLAVSGVGAYAIHGNKSQNARQAALESFRNGKARVLVATDIAARGIDIDDISHVVNYDIPNIPESYVHRIGRTARAGNSGIAIALCAPEERVFLRDIERLTRKPLTHGEPIPGLAQVAASLPPIPSKGDDRDDEAHFERGRGRVAGRRHMPSTRPATAWRDTDPARPVEAGANAPRPDRGAGRGHAGRDDRSSHERGAPRGPRQDSDRRGPRQDSDRRGPPRGVRPAVSGRSDARDTDRRGPPRDGASRSADRPSGDRQRGDRSARDRSAAPAPFRSGASPERSSQSPERGRDGGRPAERREGEHKRDAAATPARQWDNRGASNGHGRKPQGGGPAPRADHQRGATPSPRSDGPARPTHRAPSTGGDRPRRPAASASRKPE